MLEELLIGALIGSAYAGYFGHWTWVVAPVVTALWRMGGADGYSKAYRRIGVPATICGVCLILTGNYAFVVSGLLMWGVLTIGYGIPSTQPPDEGSTIGRFFFELFGRDEKKADLATRAFIGFLLALCMAPLVLYSLPHYILGACITIVAMPVVRYMELD